MASTSEDAKIQEARSTLYEAGLKMRYQVAGKEYVDRALSNASSSFAKPMQEIATQSAWGTIWARPGLSLKTRSLINISMLCALNRSTELGVHVRGALNNGASEVEIREVILQASCYCGMPAGMEGTKVAERVLVEWKGERGVEGEALGDGNAV